MRENIILQGGGATAEPLQFQATVPYRILVADDEPLILQLNTEALTDSGYQVDAAEDGAAAWLALNSDSYDLLITDNNMPGLTGVGLISKLHATRQSIPVIMATGTYPEAEMARQPWLKPAAIMLKPYTIAELLAAVEKILFVVDSVAADQLSRLSNMKNKKIPQFEMPADITLRRPAHSPPARILVVDDNSDTRQLSVDMLVGSGYDVDAVIDGAAGWEAIQDINYDLTITDNKMPKMTGIELIEKVRAMRMAVPFIMATGHLPTQEFARKPWLKPDAALQRPFSNDALLTAVKKVLFT